MKINGYSFCSSQVNIPEILRQRIVREALEIIPDQIVERRETNPHLTIRYGLIDLDPRVFREMVKHVNQFKIRFDTIGMFEKVDGGFNVLYLGVKDSVGSNGLVQLRRIADKFAAENAPTHEKYIPHITLAYVTGGENLVGEVMDVSGEGMMVRAVSFCTRDGIEHECDLKQPEKKSLSDIYNFNVQSSLEQ